MSVFLVSSQSLLQKKSKDISKSVICNQIRSRYTAREMRKITMKSFTLHLLAIYATKGLIFLHLVLTATTSYQDFI